MIARELENALASYLLTESDPSLGGLYQFKLKEGFGATLPIRTGHDNAGELPENGFVLVESLEAGVTQLVIGANAFSGTVTVQLSYPADAHDEDRKPLPSFDACVDEIGHALVRDDLPARMTEQFKGIVVMGFTAGFGFQTGIDGRNRFAQWTVSVAAHRSTNKL